MATLYTPLRGAVATACIAIAGSCGLASAQSVASSEARWNAISACASKADDRSRHACVDEVLREAGLLTVERQEKERRGRFGLDAQQVAPKAAAAPQAPVAPVVEQSDEHVEVQIATVTSAPDANLIVTTTDGAVWRQTESRAIRPVAAAGDTMVIRKASLGSFLCRVGNSVAYRCSRSR
jgi:hypothetical protein